MNIRNFIVGYASRILFGKVSEVPFDNLAPGISHSNRERQKAERCDK
jgi:hypothetical protein